MIATRASSEAQARVVGTDHGYSHRTQVQRKDLGVDGPGHRTHAWLEKGKV
eukprot:SAG11_NODE_1221_length_5486_cov_7.177650_3_plen_51_part_00